MEGLHELARMSDFVLCRSKVEVYGTFEASWRMLGMKEIKRDGA
jgi:hypothetical protein